MKWGDVCGPFHHLESNGLEEVRTCLACGKPKLYRNVLEGLWQCFGCGISGRVEMSTLGSRRVNPNNPSYQYIQKVGSTNGLFTHWMLRTSSVVLSKFPTYSMQYGTRLLGGLGLCDEDPFNACGVVTYRRPGIYVTFGTRGVLYPQRAWPDVVNAIYITEGVFDCLSLFPYCWTVCTLGNKVSDLQIASLLTLTEAPFVICFDRDQPAMAHGLKNRLRQFRQTSILFPPKQFKDWDEAIKHNKTLEDGCEC